MGVKRKYVSITGLIAIFAVSNIFHFGYFHREVFLGSQIGFTIINTKIRTTLKRVCLISPEISGVTRLNGGIGTAFFNIARWLASKGHQVTVVSAVGAHVHAISKLKWDEWVQHFATENITLTSTFGKEMTYDYITSTWNVGAAYEALLWLQRNTDKCEVVHYPEYGGIGFFNAMAKRQGLLPGNMTLVVQTHGPTVWALLGNQKWPSEKDLQIDHLERKSVAWADILASPSQHMLNWMTENYWTLPSTSIILQNVPTIGKILAESAQTMAAIQSPSEVIKELVFFGRLERRKGVFLFCDAIRMIIQEGRLNHSGIKQITFMGQRVSNQIEAITKVEELRRLVETRLPTAQITILDSMSSAEAQVYLKNERQRKLVVIPSLSENSAFTVQECLDAGIPMLASNVGGTSELIHVDDREKVLFEPTPQSLFKKLSAVLEHGNFFPVRSQIPVQQRANNWDEWHRELQVVVAAAASTDLQQRHSRRQPSVSVIISVYNRVDYLPEAISSLEAQDYPQGLLEVIVVDDGSTVPEVLEGLWEIEQQIQWRSWKFIHIENSYLGQARNRGMEEATGEYILFMDDDNIAKPHEVSTMVSIMTETRADIAVCIADLFEGNILPKKAKEVYLPTGNVGLSWYKNTMGDANFMIKQSAISRLGGFTQDRLMYEDWEFLNKAAIAGAKIELVPVGLYWKRVLPHSMMHEGTKSVETSFASEWRVLRPFLAYQGWDSTFQSALVAKHEMGRDEDQIVNLPKDYKPYQGHKNLHYEYRTGSGMWHPLRNVLQSGAMGIEGQDDYPYVGRASLHPSVITFEDTISAPCEVSIRWRSYVKGRVVVTADFELQNSDKKGDGVTIHLECNDEIVLGTKAEVYFDHRSHSVLECVEVEPGTDIRVVVNPNSHQHFDALNYLVTISHSKLDYPSLEGRRR